MPDTDELKDDDQGSRSPSHHNDQGLEDHHPDAHFPPGFPPFYGYPPDGSGGEGGSTPNGMPQFFPFPPGTPHPALYQPFAANMAGGPLFPIPIGQLTGVSQFRQKRMQVKNACVNCAQACKKCDNARPCDRCKKYGIADSCVDSARKERKKGVKRGPYKRRLKSGATVTQEQDGGDGDWHPSHEPPDTVDPSILPQPPSGASPTFGGPEGYYSYPYPYPLPPPGESANGEPGSFPPPHFFPPGYPPYPHWQPPFAQGDIIGGPDETQAQPEGNANGSGSGSGCATGGSARTSGKKKRATGASGSKKSGIGSDGKKLNGKRSAGGAGLSKSSKVSKKVQVGGLHGEPNLMDLSSVTDPSLLRDELAGMDPQIAHA